MDKMRPLMDRHPAPWTFKRTREVADLGRIDGAYEIYNANGGLVLVGGTYSGDGDEEQNLNQLEAEALCDAINLAALQSQPPTWTPCAERLPTEADADHHGMVIWEDELHGAFVSEWWARGQTHDPECLISWMPTNLKRPEPPEGM